MVRILNGEIVPDADPRLSIPRASSAPSSVPKSLRQTNLFPPTYGTLGPFSTALHIFGYQIELCWILLIGLVVLIAGPFYGVAVGALLFLYQNAANSAKVDAKKGEEQQAAARDSGPKPKNPGRQWTMDDVRRDNM